MGLSGALRKPPVAVAVFEHCEHASPIRPMVCGYRFGVRLDLNFPLEDEPIVRTHAYFIRPPRFGRITCELHPRFLHRDSMRDCAI
jgi:hypothetical protein